METEEFDKSTITQEQVEDNLETGVIMAIEEHRKLLKDHIKDHSKNQLVRLVDKAASFPNANLDGTETNKEIEAIQTLYAIKDLQVELSIINIAKQQELNDNEGGSNE